MNLSNIDIYRITHINNIPHIIRHGITSQYSANRNPEYLTIGDASLISIRRIKTIQVTNGQTHEPNSTKICLGDFIPFYFYYRMPMLYVVQNGGNFVHHPTQPEDIVYLKCSLIKTIKSQNKWYFSDGHATDNLSTFYDASMLSELPGILDWDAIQKDYWGGQDNLTIKWKKQAEFLAGSDIDEGLISTYCCYNKAAKNKLESMGIASKRIHIMPDAYF